MAYIVGFSVTGLAGRKGTYRKDLNRDTNVFFGPNGSGKTSLLKILSSAISGDASALLRVPFTEASVQVCAPEENAQFIRHIEKGPEAREYEELLANEAEDEYVGPSAKAYRRYIERQALLTWQTEPAVKADGPPWSHRYLPTSRLYSVDERWGPRGVAWRAFREELPAEDALDAFFAESVARLWGRYWSAVLQRIREAQTTGLTSILRAVLPTPAEEQPTRPADALGPEQAYAALRGFLRREGSERLLVEERTFRDAYQNNETLQRIAADIEEVEERVTKAMEPKEQLEDLIGRLFSGPKKLVIDQSITAMDDDERPVGLVSLSSGEKHLLRILVEALLAGDGTLIIDEPELSLHVDWQRQLLDAMRTLNPAMQVIAATHSPEIMAHIPDESIFSIG